MINTQQHESWNQRNLIIQPNVPTLINVEGYANVITIHFLNTNSVIYVSLNPNINELNYEVVIYPQNKGTIVRNHLIKSFFVFSPIEASIILNEIYINEPISKEIFSQQDQIVLIKGDTRHMWTMQNEASTPGGRAFIERVPREGITFFVLGYDLIVKSAPITQQHIYFEIREEESPIYYHNLEIGLPRGYRFKNIFPLPMLIGSRVYAEASGGGRARISMTVYGYSAGTTSPFI